MAQDDGEWGAEDGQIKPGGTYRAFTGNVINFYRMQPNPTTSGVPIQAWPTQSNPVRRPDSSLANPPVVPKENKEIGLLCCLCTSGEDVDGEAQHGSSCGNSQHH